MLFNAKNYFWFLLILCIILLVLPSIIRDKVSNGLFIDSQSYKSLRLGHEIRDNGLISYDELSYGGKPFFEEYGWYVLLSINPEFFARLLPFLFGVLSFIVFYFLVKQYGPEISVFASLILLASPAFIYIFSVATKYTAAIFFTLLGLYLFSKDKKYFALASFIISGFFSIIGLFFIALIFLYFGFKDRQFRNSFVVIGGFIVVFLIQFYRIFYLGLPEVIFNFNNFNFSNFFSFFIFGLGENYYGMAFFIFVLSLVGIYSYYNERFKFLLFYILLLFLLFVSFFLPFLLAYLSFFIAFFAAIGLLPFLRKDWKSKVLRFLSLLVIFCGILFSFLVFYNSVSEFEPTANYFEAVDFLKENGVYGTVFTDYRNGDYIVFAGKKTLVDMNILYAPDVGVRLDDIDTLFNASEGAVAYSILEKYDVQYILLDAKMKKDIFGNRNERLLFLLRYSPNRFVKVLENDEVELWHIML